MAIKAEQVLATLRSTLPDRCCRTCVHMVSQGWTDSGQGCELIVSRMQTIERRSPEVSDSDVCDVWEAKIDGD